MEKAESEVQRPRPPGLQRRGSRPGEVSVVFPGLVTRESCCRFSCELLKHILHQRHQLPLPYEQLLLFCKTPQEAEAVARRPVKAEGSDSRQCQRSLSDMAELLVQLETFFTLTAVPRVLLLLGGTPMSPKELYVIDMSGVRVGNGEQSLSSRPCLRQIFHAIFLADPFSELRTPAPTSLAVMVLGHRNCGTEWFRPKLNFKVPARGHTLTIRLSCSDTAGPPEPERSEDYVWFQAPISLKGFHH